MIKIKLSLRIWILIIVVALALLAIWPNFFQKGVIIKSVESNSTAFESGLKQGQIIKKINNQEVKDFRDFSKIISELFPDSEINKSKKLIINTDKGEFILFTSKVPEITVSDIPKSKIQTGLDLQGGSRALIKPEEKLSSSEINDLISVTSERLNVYGISDITIRAVSDLQGNNYMLVEVAGATPKDLKELISKQGKFEAKIGNETVFIGGKKDITSVCRNDATCSGIESCSQISDGKQACRFRFVIYLSEEAAQRHADITSKLGTNTTEFGNYLDKKLDLYLDDVLVDSLLISEGLKGKVTTQIQIQGSGTGETTQDALTSARESMHKLQTVLITGSLPFKLEIVKLDTVSPILGDRFINNLLIAGILALILVFIIVSIRYRSLKSSLLLLSVLVSEIVIILGVAAVIRWNLDLPSIAGILATIGTGVDQQIIILDESKSSRLLSIKEKLKRALFIIVGAYFTSLAALVPLYWIGAGLLKGFAVTTIIGITTGVLITRPAFADMIKKIEK